MRNVKRILIAVLAALSLAACQAENTPEDEDTPEDEETSEDDDDNSGPGS